MQSNTCLEINISYYSETYLLWNHKMKMIYSKKNRKKLNRSQNGCLKKKRENQNVYNYRKYNILKWNFNTENFLSEKDSIKYKLVMKRFDVGPMLLIEYNEEYTNKPN